VLLGKSNGVVVTLFNQESHREDIMSGGIAPCIFISALEWSYQDQVRLMSD
jgi:hypothetical protein